MTMKKIRLIVEFDGTAYAGWQWQANGPSVQQVLEQALTQALGEPVRVHCSGRTDAGVHARGMVVHFTTVRDLPEAAFREGVNRFLPWDVAVKEAVEVPLDFHARFSAKGKWYRYTIWQGPIRSPLAGRSAWHLRKPLDLGSMVRAAAAFVGEHDFAAFRSSACDAKTTRREIFAVEVARAGELVLIDVRGKGFLRNMVRVMAGTLVEIGQGKRPVDDVARLLDSGSRIAAGPTAPAQGLCLMEVWY